MRIYYLSPSQIPSRTANSVHVMKMCQALAGNGNKILLYAERGDGDLDGVDDYDHYGVQPCFKVVKISQPFIQKDLRNFMLAYTVQKQIRSIPRPDYFYSRHLYSLVAVAGFGVGLIYEAHDPPEDFFSKQIESWLYQCCNFVRLVVISEALRQEYLRLFPKCPPEKIVTAPDGADLPFYSAEAPLDLDLPARPDRFQVGYIGHLYPGKGMEIIELLAERLPEIDFHVIGGMARELDWWRNHSQLQNLYLHGFIPHAHLQSYYRFFDVMLAPYLNRVLGIGGKRDLARWMSPLKIFEYMAHEKAIICSDLPVLREILTHEVEALMVPPDDLEGWVKAIDRLRKDMNLRAALAQAGRQKVEERYTWAKRAQMVLKGL